MRLLDDKPGRHVSWSLLFEAFMVSCFWTFCQLLSFLISAFLSYLLLLSPPQTHPRGSSRATGNNQKKRGEVAYRQSRGRSGLTALKLMHL